MKICYIPYVIRTQEWPDWIKIKIPSAQQPSSGSRQEQVLTERLQEQYKDERTWSLTSRCSGNLLVRDFLSQKLLSHHFVGALLHQLIIWSIYYSYIQDISLPMYLPTFQGQFKWYIISQLVIQHFYINSFWIAPCFSDLLFFIK